MFKWKSNSDSPQIFLESDPCCCCQGQRRISSDQPWLPLKPPCYQFHLALAVQQICLHSVQMKKQAPVGYCGQIWNRPLHHLKAPQDVLKIRYSAVVTEIQLRWGRPGKKKEEGANGSDRLLVKRIRTVLGKTKMKKTMSSSIKFKDTWFGNTKSRDASLISAKIFLNAAHPSSRELPAGTIIVLRFLLTDASETCNVNLLGQYIQVWTSCNFDLFTCV